VISDEHILLSSVQFYSKIQVNFHTATMSFFNIIHILLCRTCLNNYVVYTCTNMKPNRLKDINRYTYTTALIKKTHTCLYIVAIPVRNP